MIPPGLPTMPHLPPGSGDLIPPGSGMMVGPDHPMFRQGRCGGCWQAACAISLPAGPAYHQLQWLALDLSACSTPADVLQG